MSWYDGLFGKDGFMGNIGAVGTLVGGVGTAYGNIEQAKAAKQMFDLQKDSYNDEKKRRAKTQLALDNSFKVPNPIQASLPLGV